MTPSRPYLVRAIYEWLVDNNATPYLLVDATQANVRVPTQHVKDGKIVLNIAPHAVKDLFIRNEGISFSARFGGVPMMVSAPMAAVAAIYARENGQGMFFDNAEEYANVEKVENVTVAEPVKPNLSVATENTDSEVSSENPERPKGRPTLSVVK
ncbi:MAG TPA: ClpXP protease specificity-enhancing factor [Agitococcus sp.]|uniref:ClpXP protease specificity-enhancing factor n=1 Tax=uncultured Agitococcus sp. TaxID=1506599 RepID=UPI0026212CC9|nr:ClpXP protease specificity-enhancing factor [uncultured Agitococcus sp.]HRH91179.1 ClpXP protease specificity-enhancing factor [Agitococcus sp.]